MPPRRSGRLPKHTEKASENSGAGVKSSQQKRGRKRAASANNDETRKMQKKAVDGREIDTFCWICHKNGQDMICSSCPRVFHAECLKKSRSKISPSGICHECQSVSVSGNSNVPKISRNVLKNLLLISMQEVLREDGKKSSKVQAPENSKFCRYFKTWPQGADNGYLCYLIDLDIIIDKINNAPSYSTIAEFFGDIKWLYHNCYILYGTDSERTETAQKLLKNFKQELLDMEACPECYSNKHSDEHLPIDFFTRVCQEPHDIVWAKLRGSPYWPAKVLQIYNGHADIRFFGTHDKSVIPLNQCFRISQESPYGKVVKRPNYKDAISELSIYVKNYENRFGSFYFYPDRTSLENTQKKDSSKRGKQRMNAEHSGIPDAEDRVAAEESINANISNSYSDTCISDNNQRNDLATVTNSDQDPISVCMTFTADEESASLNHQAELIGESSLNNSFPQNFSESIATSISGSAGYASNESSFKDLQPCVDSVTDCSSNFINSEGNTGPCIESVSNCANYSFSSQENLSSNTGEVTSDNSHQVAANHSDNPTSNSANQGASHYCDQVIPSSSSQETPNLEVSLDRSANTPAVTPLFNQLAQNLNRRFEADEDTQEISVILEKIADNKIVTDLLKHKKLTDALIQRLLRHHPEWKRAYNEMNMFMKGMFLQMWLAIEQVTIEERAIKAFAAVYEAEREKREEFEKENILLKQEIQQMKSAMDDLKEQVEQKRAEREANRDLIIKALYRRINVNSKRLLDKLIQHMMENGSYQSHSSLLEDPTNHAECLRQIVEKDRELKVCQSDVIQLRAKFKDICKVEKDQAQKIKSETQSVESETQTVLTVSPDNVTCTLTEVKEEEIKEKVLCSKITDVQKTISCVENKESDKAEDSKAENKDSTDKEDSQCRKKKNDRTESIPWKDAAVTYEEETVVRTQEVIMPVICAVPSDSGICPSGIPPVYSVVVSTSMDVSSSVVTTQRTEMMEIDANEE